jgi:hypothetical protein
MTDRRSLSILITLTLSALTACSTTSPNLLCSGRLQPINAPTPITRAPSTVRVTP